MNFLELVHKRQSVRQYSETKVPRELIESCLETARLAPSACNSQPWSFIAVDDKKLKTTLAEMAFSGIYSMNQFAKTAPVIIAVITEKSRFQAKLGGYFRGTNFSLIDVGIACEHLILQAAEKGLGTCLLGWFNEKKVKKILKVPDSKKIDLLISLGYPASDLIRGKKRFNLNEIIQWNA